MEVVEFEVKIKEEEELIGILVIDFVDEFLVSIKDCDISCCMW